MPTSSHCLVTGGSRRPGNERSPPGDIRQVASALNQMQSGGKHGCRCRCSSGMDDADAERSSRRRNAQGDSTAGGPRAEAPTGRKGQLELLISRPQHSGRCGILALSHPPPRAWINNTALAIRRPRILTAVTSSVSAAFCAVITSR